MKLLNKSHKRRNLIIAFAILLALVVCGTIAWWLFLSKSPASDTLKNAGTNYDKPSAEQQKAGNQIKSNASKQGTSGSDQPPAPTPISGSTQEQVGVTITSTQSSDSQYLIRSVINTATSAGTCTLKMEKAGTPTITMSASTQPLASTSTCKGFNVPLSSLSSGTWNITIDFSDGSLVGSATKQVSI